MRSLLVLVALLFGFLFVTGSPVTAVGKPDPVVGVWATTTRVGEVLMEFSADRRVRYSVPGVMKAAREAGKNPLTANIVRQKIEKASLRWTRVGEVYRIEVDPKVLKGKPKPKQGPSYVRIVGGKLLECDARGKLRPGKRAMVRKKKA